MQDSLEHQWLPFLKSLRHKEEYHLHSVAAPSPFRSREFEFELYHGGLALGKESLGGEAADTDDDGQQDDIPKVPDYPGLASGIRLWMTRTLFSWELIRARIRFQGSRKTAMQREWEIIGGCCEATRGVPLIHVNLPVKRESEKASGLSQPQSESHLFGYVNQALRRIWRAAHLSECREYDIWILGVPKDHPENADESSDTLDCSNVTETRAVALLPPDVELNSLKRAGVATASDLRVAAKKILAPDSAEDVMDRTEPAEGCFRLMTYNVHACVGMDGQLSPRRIARVIAQAGADVICLQELDVGRVRSHKLDQAHEIAKYLVMDFQFHPAWHIEEEKFGNAVLTRWPMRVVRADGLHHHKADRSRRSALWVEIQLGRDTKLQIVNTHMSIYPQEQLIQATELLREWVKPASQHGPVVLCGDFNARPNSATHRALSAEMRDVESFDAAAAQRTYFSPYPLMRLDHIFVEGDLHAESVRAVTTRLARIASDHVPLLADFKLGVPSEQDQ